MLVGYTMPRVCRKMYSVRSMTFCIVFAIYMVVCVQLNHSKLDDWMDIYVTYISHQKYQPFHFRHIFRVWVSYVAVPFRHSLHIDPRWGLFLLFLCRLWWAQNGYIMAWKSYSFVCTLQYITVIIMQTCLKALAIYMLVSYTTTNLVTYRESFKFILYCNRSTPWLWDFILRSPDIEKPLKWFEDNK